MRDNITIIICCAGMGTRLGIGTTKALIDVYGKSLIERQVEMMSDISDVRVVVGYQAEKVIDAVKDIRKDVLFAFNYEFKNTGESESLSKALIGLKEYTMIVDGDLLINPSDFEKILNHDGECIGICDLNSDEPIFAILDNDKVVELNEDHGEYEYSCVAKVKSSRLKSSVGSIYSLIQKFLPMESLWIRTRDIDTPDDYDRMLEWYKKSCE